MTEELVEQSSMKSLDEYWAMVVRRRWWILGPLFLGWLLVFASAWVIPPKYTSESLILVEGQKVPQQFVLPNVQVDLEERLQSITQQGQCEDVGIKVTPVTILPGAPQLSNGKEFVTRVKLTKGADNVSCTGEAATIPMSPGKWKFTGNLPSEVSTCERDIVAGGNLVVNFKDGETACN